MKTRISKIWFPLAVVMLAAVQGFASEASRISALRKDPSPENRTDTVIYSNKKIFTKFRSAGYRIEGDSTYFNTYSEEEGPIILARDTMKVPQELQYTDPFRYKYYVALNDSLTHKQVRDSLRAAGDSLDWPKIDSIYYADSAARAKAAFDAWYASLDKSERKKYDFEQKMKRKQREIDSTLNVKDSLLAIRDSIRENTPRVLETFAVPDSMQYKRIISWTVDPLFNDLHLHDLDTNYNYWFYDYPFERRNPDIMVSYLGTSGSPVQPYDFFHRGGPDGISFYRPLEIYTYTPSTLPMYNTKTAYTELAYWGTLFANSDVEEGNLHILTTQNILPSLNYQIGYDRNGSKGILEHEDTDNRTFHFAMNYIGKKYSAQAGYIHHKASRDENGGIIDTYWIRDTTVGAREIDVYLDDGTDASSLVKSNTVFLDQVYRIPFSFIKNLGKGRKKESVTDSLPSLSAMPGADSSFAGVSPMPGENPPSESTVPKEGDANAAAIVDPNHKMIDTDVTTAFIGHNSEWTVMRRTYDDDISSSDSLARSFYNNRFYIDPEESSDSVRVMRLENKVFLKLQPWSSDAIVSSLNVGIGNRIQSHYMFRPEGYLVNPSNTVWNSTYVYAGAGGQWRKYLSWSARGYYTFLGDEINDFGVLADASMSFCPFRKARKSPVTLSAHFETTLDEPEYFAQHYYSNHHRWDNDFSKISTTKIQAKLSIPYWKMEIEGAYALLGNNIYYDETATPMQNTTAMSVAKLMLRKNFALSVFHMDNAVLFQVSSNEDVLPLPRISANLRWYLQLDVVKKVLQMQLGVNATYNTKWYAPAYDPSLGVFHNQSDEKFGGCPYFDAFLNMQWKRACIFVKWQNVGMGWPMSSADYFSASKYIRPQRAIKVGLYWPFYLQTKKTSTMSSRASTTGGGGGGAGNMNRNTSR